MELFLTSLWCFIIISGQVLIFWYIYIRNISLYSVVCHEIVHTNCIICTHNFQKGMPLWTHARKKDYILTSVAACQGWSSWITMYHLRKMLKDYPCWAMLPSFVYLRTQDHMKRTCFSWIMCISLWSHWNFSVKTKIFIHCGIVAPYGATELGSYYLKQCWVIISEVLWHSPVVGAALTGLRDSTRRLTWGAPSAKLNETASIFQGKYLVYYIK